MNPARKTVEAIVTLVLIAGGFAFMGAVMGPQNLIKTIMETAYDLLVDTVLYLVAITVIVGAFSAVLIEFGVARLLERLLSPLMKPVYGLPGVASLGGVLCFLSDNPAIISLAKDKGYRAYFKPRQLFSLVNFGTSLGMGLIVISYMIGQGADRTHGRGFALEAVIGLVGAVVGGIVATRLMQFLLRKVVDDGAPDTGSAKAAGGNTGGNADGNANAGGNADGSADAGGGTKAGATDAPAFDEDKIIGNRNQGVFARFLNAILDGGKTGLEAGALIVPGVLVISTAVTLLTNGPRDPFFGYRGLAYEGVPVLPWIGGHLKWLFDALFGFTSPQAIAFPVTSLGAVGAALGLVPQLLNASLVGPNDIAVFTAMGMCWSGFLSTHTGMMDALGRRDLVSRTILSQTLGGLVAGVAAHYLWLAFHALGLA